MGKRDEGQEGGLPDLTGGTGDAPGGVMIRTAAGGTQAFLQPVEPRGVARLSEGQADLLAALQRESFELREAAERVDAAAALARDEGVSWSLIGWSVGLTAEGARRRWGGDS